jgi:hypothetical protein
LVSREVAARLGRVPTTWGDPKAVVALGAGAATTAMLTSTPAATGAEVLTGDAPLTEATIGPDPPLMHADSPATVGLGPTTAPEPADHRVSEPEPTRARSVGSAGAPEPADVLEPGTAEPSPIPPFTRAEPATADDDVDAEPSDPVLLDPDAVLADEAVTSTTSRRRRALVLVAAGVVALIAGVVVFGGQDPKVETGTTVLPPETSIQVGAEDISRTVDPTTKAGGVGVAATFVLRGPDGDALTTDIALTNTTTESITASHIEAIPKGWAPSADQVTFTVQPTEIIDADPVVRWDLPLDAGQTVHLVYEVALGNIEMSQEALDEQLELRDQAGASFLTDHPWAQAFSAFTGAPMTELTWATRPGEPVGPGTTASNTPGPGCPPDCGPDTTLSGGGGGGGGGGGPTTQTTQTTPTQQPTPSAPGSVSGVRVQSPSGPQGAMRVSLNWAAPGSGGAPSGYRVRATTRALNFTGDGCTGGARDVRSSTYPATGTSGSFVSPSTAEACSWVVWEVQAWNSGGSSSWATARGVLPSVKGQWEAYHLVRAVGGLAVNGGTVSCGIERDNHCSTSPTGEIAPGTLVRVFTQS